MFVQYDARPGGAPTSGLLIVKGFLEAGWAVDSVFGASGPLAAAYEEAGSCVHVACHGQWLVGGGTVRRLRRWGRELRAAMTFIGLMRRLKPDLVYVNSLMGLAPALAARALGIPCIWHIRELFKEAGGEVHDPLGGRKVVRWILRLTARRIVVVSRAVMKNVLACEAEPRVTVITNAVAQEFFNYSPDRRDCRLRLNLPLDAMVIGVPGSLRPVKGHPFFLKSARLVMECFPQCHFIISGDGEPQYRQNLLTQVTELGLEGCVHFLGTMQDMRTFYRACDVVCVPSVSEAFPRTAIESFVMRVPLVATRVGGMAEIVNDGENGFLVPYGDCETLVDRILRLLQDPQLREKMAFQARQKAESCYREEAYRRRVLDVVVEVMQEARKEHRS